MSPCYIYIYRVHIQLYRDRLIYKGTNHWAKIAKYHYFSKLEHPQQWSYNFSYLAPSKLILSILPTQVL